MWWVAGGVVAAYLIHRIRLRRFGDDILKVELFRHLHNRNTQDAIANANYKDAEKRIWRRIWITTGSVYVFTFFALAIPSKISISWLLPISAIPALACGRQLVKRSKNFREITLPLYVTLCLIPGSRWDPADHPARWITVNQEFGEAVLRLPKDLNATLPFLKGVNALINARLVGKWSMRVDTQNFLLTFTRENEATTVRIPEIDLPELDVSKIDPGDFVVMDKEIEGDDSPW